MRQQKSHDINKALREDGRRLVVTLIAVVVIVFVFYRLEQRNHFVERFIVVPTSKVATSPAPSVSVAPSQKPAATTKK